MFSNPFCVASFWETFNAHNITTYDVKYIIKNIYCYELLVTWMCFKIIYFYNKYLYNTHSYIYFYKSITFMTEKNL